jgi:hypothetical protein
MEKITEQITNALTGEVIEIELTAEQIEQWKSDKAFAEQEFNNAKTEKESAKAALLQRLGMTAEEAELLLS